MRPGHSGYRTEQSKPWIVPEVKSLAPGCSPTWSTFSSSKLPQASELWSASQLSISDIWVCLWTTGVLDGPGKDWSGLRPATCDLQDDPLLGPHHGIKFLQDHGPHSEQGSLGGGIRAKRKPRFHSPEAVLPASSLRSGTLLRISPKWILHYT